MAVPIVVMVVVAVALLLAIAYLTTVVPTRWLKVEHVDAKLGLGITVLQISDIHIERMRVKVERLVSLIATEKPALLLLTGDFIDEDRYLGRLNAFLKPLIDTGVPAVAVLGNHDYFMDDVERLIGLLHERGITVLQNHLVTVGTLQIAGIDDYCTGRHDMTVLEAADPTRPLIIVTHDPTITLSLRKPYDYLVAGHLHGKQFAIPFLFQLQDFGPLARSGVYKGLHESEQGRFYISKGLGQSGVNLRFLVRSEVTVHRL